MTHPGRSSVVTNLPDSGSPETVALTLCIVYCTVHAAFVVLPTNTVTYHVLESDMLADDLEQMDIAQLGVSHGAVHHTAQ